MYVKQLIYVKQCLERMTRMFKKIAEVTKTFPENFS